MTRLRRRRGSALSEFGPALWLFLIMIFFPSLNIIAATLQYSCGWYINFALTREAAVRKIATDDLRNQVKTDIKNDFQAFAPGIQSFLKVANDPIMDSTITPTQTQNGIPGTVTVTTPVTGQPFLFIPIPFVTAPGLNQNYTFNISSERPREVND